MLLLTVGVGGTLCGRSRGLHYARGGAKENSPLIDFEILIFPTHSNCSIHVHYAYRM